MEKHLLNSSDSQHQRLAKRLETCRLYRGFGSQTPKYCNLNRFVLCRSCFLRKSRIEIEAGTKRFVSICRKNQLLPVFITLRPPAGPALKERFDSLNDLLKKIQQSRKNHASGRVGFNEFCRPAYIRWVIEIAKVSDGINWLPHAHGIALNPIDAWEFNLTALKRKWADFTDEVIPPDVKASPEIRSLATLKTSDPALIARHVRKMLRYSVKASPRQKDRWLSIPDRVHAFDTLQNKRLIREWKNSDLAA